MANNRETSSGARHGGVANNDKVQSTREAFEAWYFDKFLVRAERYSLDPEQYAYPHTRDTWEGWQAGREAIAAPGVATDEKTIALAMLAVDDPLQWGRLGPDSKKMIVQFVRALAAPSPTAEQRPPYCGSGHCSCIECPYGAPVTIKGGPAE